METVTIGCRLPNGIVLEVGLETTARGGPQNGLVTRIRKTEAYRRYVLKGHHEHNRALFRQGIRLPATLKPEPFINRNVPKDLWDQWNKEHPASWLVSSGAIFVISNKDEGSVKAAAIDASAKSPQPLAPIDPTKPLRIGEDTIETADFQPKAAAAAKA